MADAVAEYDKLVQALTQTPGVTAGQMFGKPCLKVNGKAFVAQHHEAVVFKLTAPQHARALAVAGAVLWDPSGKQRPMKEWVAVPAAGCKQFKALAQAALEYVSTDA
jgi:hypothetical protein